jgi:phosphoribosylaminoimidazole-succinocarboxamide synthase
VRPVGEGNVGSGWEEYQRHGTVHGIQMPAGLQESEKLERPLFTPSTKAEQGEHDENIHPDQCIPFCVTAYLVRELIGAEKTAKIEQLAIALYTKVPPSPGRS